MGGCLTASREFKQNESEIHHNTLERARRSQFWEHAGALKNEEGEGLTTDSNLDETVQTWQSMNLYEMSTTQCARMTQSKVKKTLAEVSYVEDVEPSVTDVQKDFDINSPIASETFNKQYMEDFHLKSRRTDSSLQDPQQSFEVSQKTSGSGDIAKVSEVDSALTSPALTEDQGALTKKPSDTLSPVKMYDASLQSYSTVDEFDEPKVVKQNKKANATTDSFDQLLVEPSGNVVYPDEDSAIVSTRSGRWGTIA